VFGITGIFLGKGLAFGQVGLQKTQVNGKYLAFSGADGMELAKRNSQLLIQTNQ